MRTRCRRCRARRQRKVLNAVPAPYDVTGVHAGATEPTHEKTLEMSWKQYSVPVEGQSDIVIFPHPVHLARTTSTPSSTRCWCR